MVQPTVCSSSAAKRSQRGAGTFRRGCQRRISCRPIRNAKGSVRASQVRAGNPRCKPEDRADATGGKQQNVLFTAKSIFKTKATRAKQMPKARVRGLCRHVAGQPGRARRKHRHELLPGDFLEPQLDVNLLCQDARVSPMRKTNREVALQHAGASVTKLPRKH